MMVRPLQHFHFFRNKTPSKQASTQETVLKPLAINTGTNILNLQVEIADTDAKRELGLMHRPSLGSNKGMLFIFDKEEAHTFWMKNTLISLDMLFINADRRVITIAPNTTPLSEATIAPQGPVQYVLEVNAGYAAKNGVRVGNQISF